MARSRVTTSAIACNAPRERRPGPEAVDALWAIMGLVPLTPQHVLRERLLVTLAAYEGASATRADVLTAMDAAFGAAWTPEDLQAPASKPWETMWRNRASFERADMVRDGLLANESAGTWSLADAGR